MLSGAEGDVPQEVTEASAAIDAAFVPEVSDEVAEETIIEPEEDDSDLYSINSFTV